MQSAKPGSVRTIIFVMTADHQPLAPKEVTLVLTKPDLGLEPLERPAVLAAPGEWHVDGVVVPVGGRWQVRLDLLVTDFEKVALEGEVDMDTR